jgi:putative oxidoreductase
MTSRFGITMPRAFYGIALIAFGIQHFLFGDFIAGRAPEWPGELPGRFLFAYASGLSLVVGGLGVLVNKKARLAMVISGMVILIWAALRNIYGIAMNPEYGGLLTNTFKALTIGSGAFIVADTFMEERDASSLDRLISAMAVAGKYFLGFFLFIAGVQHFLFVDFVKFLVPTWIPGDIFWTYFSAFALIAAGLGLITGIKVSLAAHLAGWMVLAWVFLLHVPRAIVNANQNEWTAVFEALAVSGLLFLIYAKESRVPQTVTRSA